MEDSNGLLLSELKDLLDSMAERYNVPDFIERDPVQFPREYTLKQDIEISAFLTAAITWGKRSLILRSASRMHEIMGCSPYDYIMEKGYENLGSANIHRTFFEDDLSFLCRGLHAIYQRNEDCESLFVSQLTKGGDIWDALHVFREQIRAANDEGHRGLKHISDPQSSACKRLHLALRWLVRNDGIVDIGVWRNVSPSQLKIPLDTHVIRVARALGLLQRKQNDRKAVEELTANLLRFNPEDPVLYDFALFGLGESRIFV